MTRYLQDSNHETGPMIPVTLILLLLILFLGGPEMMALISSTRAWNTLNPQEQQLVLSESARSLPSLNEALLRGMPVNQQFGSVNLVRTIVLDEELDLTEQKSMLQAAISAGADIDIASPITNSPLAAVLISSRSDWKETAEMLIELGADIDRATMANNPILSYLIRTAPDHNSSTSFHLQRWLHEGDKKPVPFWKKKIAWLVEQGDQLNPRVYIYDKTLSNGHSFFHPLMGAIQEGKSQQLISLLLELGADPNLSQYSDDEPLGSDETRPEVTSPVSEAIERYRCQHGVQVVQMLLDAGADVNPAVIHPENLPLVTAARECTRENSEIMAILVAAGALPQNSILEITRRNKALRGTTALEALEKAVAAAEIESATAKR
ncbi:MAG: hypothetical protein VX764_01765 [Planctomycetota bacterium]|nr:hypothetical protein [Planctomycetota bacterium]